MFRTIRNAFSNLRKLLVGYVLYWKDIDTYSNALAKSDEKSKKFQITQANKYPCVKDRWNKNGGAVDSSYFLSTIEIAKQVIDKKPEMHFDIGSTIEHFISKLLAARINVTVIDIRPFSHKLQGMNFIQGNAMKDSVK